MTKSRPWPVIGRTIFFTSDKNRPTNQKPAITYRDEIYFIDFWRKNLSMYRIRCFTTSAKLAFTCTSLPLSLITSVFGCGCGFGFEQKFGGSTDLAKKRHRSADLHTPIHPTPDLIPSLRSLEKNNSQDRLLCFAC